MKNTKQPTSKEMHTQIVDEYSRWKNIFDNGCTDPLWTDGMNINLVRSHIRYLKRRVEEVLGNNYIAYPDSYFYPEPTEMPNDFMAVSRKLITDGFLTANKNMCYNDVVKFTTQDWRDALCV